MDVHGSQQANLQGFCSCGSLGHLRLLWVVPIEVNAMVLGCFLSETHSTQYIHCFIVYITASFKWVSLQLSLNSILPNPENQ